MVYWQLTLHLSGFLIEFQSFLLKVFISFTAEHSSDCGNMFFEPFKDDKPAVTFDFKVLNWPVQLLAGEILLYILS